MEEKKEFSLPEVPKPFYVEGRGVFVPIINKVVAMQDSFDGKPVEWEDAVEAGAPTKEDWYIILYYKDEINRLLAENGGKPIRNSIYWSSSEYSRLYAWLVNFSSGYVTTNLKYNPYYVRAVAAF